MRSIPDAQTFEFDRDDVERAAAQVHAAMNATPQYCWPLLSERVGCEVWVKHEDCTPVGAFKVRGGITYFNRLSTRNVRQVVCATRGNHGISIAFNGTRIGVRATIFVPRGNSIEKNDAMRSWGAEVIEQGEDFQQSLEYAADYAAARNVHFVPSFDAALVVGVASLGLEFLSSVELDIVYAPIGLGSGLAGLLAARKALNVRTEVVGVVAAGARAYAESMRAQRLVELPVSTFADGMACRTPNAGALEFFWKASPRMVEVSDDEIAEAMRLYFYATHHVAEPAGAASLAAAMREPLRKSGKRIGVILSGANVDTDLYSSVLRGQTPHAD